MSCLKEPTVKELLSKTEENIWGNAAAMDRIKAYVRTVEILRKYR